MQSRIADASERLSWASPYLIPNGYVLALVCTVHSYPPYENTDFELSSSEKIATRQEIGSIGDSVGGGGGSGGGDKRSPPIVAQYLFTK